MVNNNTIVIVLIVWLETIALLKGVNGVLLTTVIGTLASMVGFSIGKRKR